MKRFSTPPPLMLFLAVLATSLPALGAEPATAGFTPLAKLSSPKLLAAAEAYPGGGYNADNILDGIADGSFQSEYASAGIGTETFLDFDFGQPKPIAGFRHVDRHDPATVGTAVLTFSDAPDFQNVLATVKLKHANVRAGVTCAAFRPVTARYVRWKVTGLGGVHATVGGAEIEFYAAGKAETTPARITVDATSGQALLKNNGRPLQPARIVVDYPYLEPCEALLEIAGCEPAPLAMRFGTHTIETLLPAAETEQAVRVAVKINGQVVLTSELTRKPVRPWTFYILPHSHVDIGYTHVQTEVEQMQGKYFEQAIELARATADNPPGARFKWNSEVLWAVDGYLKRATPEQRKEFASAVKKGWIGLDGLYGNELTALCRPEELYRLLGYARRLSTELDVPVEAAMISDVPGYTWGIVPALADSRVKYLSIGPNHCHRIGYTLQQWGDRAFYWVSPCGRRKVLCWMAGKAYSWFHGGRLGLIGDVEPGVFFDYLDELAAKDYPYDMVQLRYSTQGDNGPPDPNLPEFVKKWNAKYAAPRMVIATTAEMFHEFERRYGESVPEVRGDFTPYWEDGAGSSAAETAMTRTASEQLVQAEALFAMLRPGDYPRAAFYSAWRNVILYNEHTWGAHCSISQPDDPFTKDQWKIKQAFATDAAAEATALTTEAMEGRKISAEKVTAVDVYNTTSWSRTDLIALTGDQFKAGSVVRDAEGREVPSQRSESGQLLLVARDVPPLGAKRFLIEEGNPTSQGSARAEGNVLTNGNIRLTVDEKTGAIDSLTVRGVPVDLVDLDSGMGLNEYFYVAGRDPSQPGRNAPVTITVQERGPVVASLVIVSDAPGCRKLRRTVRLVDGIDRVDLQDTLDKEPVLAKESVHFGFPFNVPGGVMRMDTPWAVVRPEIDQLPGACKNYFTVGRWVDVSNDDFGVTWTTRDAPLIEVGAITVDVPHPVGGGGWIEHVEPSTTFYSYVMNNYWETNYKASQEGTVRFDYCLRPHGRFDSAAATRFGIEQSQPLIVVPADRKTPPRESLLRIDPIDVIVSSIKSSRDGKALMVRLFNASNQPIRATLTWGDPVPEAVFHSSPFEEQGDERPGAIELPPRGIVTLRASLP